MLKEPFYLKYLKEVIATTIPNSQVSYHKKFTNVQIDVHTKGQGFWGFFYLLEDEILDHKRRYKEFFVVSDFHRHLFNWLDKLLWGELKPKYSNPIKKSMIKETTQLDSFLKKIFLNKKTVTAIKKSVSK